MFVPALLLPLTLHLDGVNQKPPDDNDVVAGWVAFAVFILLVAAVAFLGWSLTRQFKKVRAAQEAGVFDDPEEDRTDEGATDADHGAGTDGGSTTADDGATPKG